jgi:integrase/recombinase XerD
VVTWHEAIKLIVSDKTLRRYLVSLSQWSSWLAGKPLASIDPPFLRNLLKERQRMGVTNATIRRDLTALASIFNSAIDEGWIETNPVYLLNRRRIPERREPIPLPGQHSIKAMRNALPRWLADMMDFADETGMRQDEIVRLEWSLIKLDQDEATLYKTKRKRIRTINFTKEAIAILERQPRSPHSKLVFWHDDGRPYEWVSSRFCAVTRKVAQSDSQFVRFRFHDLRHNFAVRYLRERRGSLYDLQKLLGHSSIKTTEQYLDFLTPSQQRFAKSG